MFTLDSPTENTVTYLMTDNGGNRIADLPLSAVTFQLPLNAAGAFGATLNVEDPRVAKLGWLAATAPNLVQVWVDIDGQLMFGGRITGRNYQKATQAVTLRGIDNYGYLAQRTQARDYLTNWSTNATKAGAAQIAQTVLSDILGVANSLGISVSTPAATPAGYQITYSAPKAQAQTGDAIISTLSKLGWNVGFDYALDCSYVAGVPTSTINVSYPRRGRIAGTTGAIIDLDKAIDWSWDEDGSQQANVITETASGGGGANRIVTYDPSLNVDGYPLLERVGSHSSVCLTPQTTTSLTAWGASDLAMYAYPVVTPQITLPLFSGDLPIGSALAGDEVHVVLRSDATRPANPRFPHGLDTYLRIVRIDVTIPTEGIPTQVLTMSMPLSSTPIRPPQ